MLAGCGWGMGKSLVHIGHRSTVTEKLRDQAFLNLRTSSALVGLVELGRLQRVLAVGLGGDLAQRDILLLLNICSAGSSGGTSVALVDNLLRIGIIVHLASPAAADVEAQGSDHTAEETDTVVLEANEHTGGGDHDNKVGVALLVVEDTVVHGTGNGTELDTTDKEHHSQDCRGVDTNQTRERGAKEETNKDLEETEDDDRDFSAGTKTVLGSKTAGTVAKGDRAKETTNQVHHTNRDSNGGGASGALGEEIMGQGSQSDDRAIWETLGEILVNFT